MENVCAFKIFHRKKNRRKNPAEPTQTVSVAWPEYWKPRLRLQMRRDNIHPLSCKIFICNDNYHFRTCAVRILCAAGRMMAGDPASSAGDYLFEFRGVLIDVSIRRRPSL